MSDFLKQGRLAFAFSVFSLAALFSGCSGYEPVSQDFVGKWKSSRLATPLLIHANGDWEIKQEDGGVLQYGVWQYKDKSFLWSYKLDGEVGHDRNALLSFKPGEFQLREKDGSTTTFLKLD